MQKSILIKPILILAGILCLAFIGASVKLVTEVKEAQLEVRHKVNCISAANALRSISNQLQKELEGQSKLTPQLLDSAITISKEHPDLTSISTPLKAAQSDLNEGDILKAKKQLLEVNEMSGLQIGKKRIELAQISRQLSTYWNYTHAMLIAASILGILLVLSIVRYGRIRSSLEKERNKNYQLLNNSSSIIISTDINGKVEEFNRTAEEYFGYKKAEVQQLDLSTLYKKKEELKAVKQALDEHGYYDGEILNVSRDNKIFLSYLRANHIIDEQGKLIGTMGISRDITEEKRKEQEVNNILENAQDIIYTTNESGELTYVNTSMVKLMGYSHSELIGMHYSDLVHPDNREEVSQFYRSQFFKLKKSTYLEFKGITKNKETVWLAQNLTAIFNPINQNRISAFQGVVRDISQRKETEIKLQRSEENFRMMVSSIEDVFYLFDYKSDRFKYISPNTKEVLGIEPEFFRGNESFYEKYLHPLDQKKAFAADLKVMKGQSFDIEYRVMVDNKVIWVNDRSYPIKDEKGNVIGASGICKNITEIKEASILIEHQNLEIKQSISYASNIQASTIQTRKEYAKIYPDMFVFYRPRDLLSGDFYFIDRLNFNSFGELTFFVVADCTGHGIPGGMLSFLCNSLIREALNSPEVDQISDILSYTRNKLLSVLNHNRQHQIHDGMEVSVVALNTKTQKAYFTAANHSCYIVRDNHIHEYKGTRQSVGYNTNPTPFTETAIQLQKGDTIYLNTDGYPDQFGGPRSKKFLRNRLYKMYENIASKSIEEQAEKVESTFEQWKGDSPQIDDVCLMGIKI